MNKLNIEGMENLDPETMRQVQEAHEHYSNLPVEEKLEYMTQQLSEAIDMLQEQSTYIETLSKLVLGAQEFCKEALEAMLAGKAQVAKFLDNHEDLVKGYLEVTKNIKMH